MITRAEQAKDFYANDTKYTETSMTNVESYLEGILAEKENDGGEVEKPVVETITFDITGEKKTAEKGMTWGEWVASEYNTDGYEVDGERIKLYDGAYNQYISMGEPGVDSNWTTLVSGSEQIIENYSYYKVDESLIE